jgi:hypothetical protein
VVVADERQKDAIRRFFLVVGILVMADTFAGWRFVENIAVNFLIGLSLSLLGFIFWIRIE